MKRPKLVRCLPTSGPNSTDFDRIPPAFDPLRRDIGEIRLNLAQGRTNLAWNRPSLARNRMESTSTCRISVDIPRSQPNILSKLPSVSQSWPLIGQLRPDIDQPWPDIRLIVWRRNDDNLGTLIAQRSVTCCTRSIYKSVSPGTPQHIPQEGGGGGEEECKKRSPPHRPLGRRSRSTPRLPRCPSLENVRSNFYVPARRLLQPISSNFRQIRPMLVKIRPNSTEMSHNQRYFGQHQLNLADRCIETTLNLAECGWPMSGSLSEHTLGGSMRAISR